MSDTAKELIFDEEARAKLRAGIDMLCRVVSPTLGPKGRNVGLESSFGPPTITSVGHSLVKDIELKDQYENMGVALGKEVASKMKEKCGDGTTTAILLLGSLVQTGVKNIASGSSPIALKRGMEKALEAVLQQLETLSVPIQSDVETKNIATVSASGNEEIGSMISEAFQKVGVKGVITVEEGRGRETKIELVEGMQFDRGYTSAYFCTNAETLTVEMEEARILVTDKKISSIQEILQILQAVSVAGQSLLIIADDLEGDALSTLVVNRLRGTLKVCAVKAPGFGDRRKALLQDIAIVTGATLVSEETGLLLKDATADVLGSAEKIVVTKDKTILVNGSGSPEEIASRVKQIEAEMALATSSYDKEKLEERRAKLSGGVAVIRVAGTTEPEVKEKRQRFTDSLNATRAALEEGVLVGGGVALLRAASSLQLTNLLQDEKIGAQIVLKACEAPMRQIVANAGFDPSLILEEVQRAPSNSGFNALSEKIEDLLLAGVMDPTKLVKSALSFAVSVAGIILLSEVLIGNAPEDLEAK